MGNSRMRRCQLDQSCVFAEDLGDLNWMRQRYDVNGNPTIVNSPLGLASSFDGVNDRYDVGYHQISLPAATYVEFSVCVWVLFNTIEDGAGENNHLVSDWNTWNPGGQQGFSLMASHTGALPEFDVCDGTNYNSATVGSTVLDTGVWYHMAGTFNAGATRVYLDGVEEDLTATGFASIELEKTTDITIAWGGVTAGYTDAVISNVLMYTRELTAAEIADLASGDAF